MNVEMIFLLYNPYQLCIAVTSKCCDEMKGFDRHIQRGFDERGSPPSWFNINVLILLFHDRNLIVTFCCVRSLISEIFSWRDLWSSPGHQAKILHWMIVVQGIFRYLWEKKTSLALLPPLNLWSSLPPGGLPPLRKPLCWNNGIRKRLSRLKSLVSQK